MSTKPTDQHLEELKQTVLDLEKRLRRLETHLSSDLKIEDDARQLMDSEWNLKRDRRG